MKSPSVNIKDLEEVQILTAEAKRYLELDRLAYDFVTVDNDIKKLSSLNFEEHAYVMSMAYLYTMYRLGALSKESCKEIKRKRMKECQSIHNSYMFQRHLHKRWVLCTKEYAEEKKELISMVKRKDPRSLQKALQLIDVLSGAYIYSGLYERVDDADKQTQLFEEIIDEATDEYDSDEDRERLKQLIGQLIEGIEGGEIDSPSERMTEEEKQQILENFPEKEQLTEELIKSVMPRVKK